MSWLQAYNDTRIPANFLFQDSEQIEVISPSEHGPKLQFQVFCNGMPIGLARLEKLLPGTAATSTVVSILNGTPRTTFTLKMIQVTQNYRQRGIGTVLLKEILHYCRHHNIRRINGEIKGDDMPALATWYTRNGFLVTNGTWLELDLA